MATVRVLAGLTQIAIGLAAIGLALGVFDGELRILSLLVALQNSMNGLIRCTAFDQDTAGHG